MATLEQYNSWRNRLIALINQTVAATEKYAPEKAKIYAMLGKQLREDTLKIQVVGTVKNGKSSFTNALIGEDILPVDDIPCTAISSEVKYGPEKKALVSFYSPLPTGLLNEIPAETAAYLRDKKLGKGPDGKDVPIPAMEIPYGHMHDYVAIPEAPMEIMMDPDKFKAYQERIAMESPYDVGCLYYPAEFLKDGVELVDSPGLNEHPRRTAVTLDYLKRADAAIYLLDASKTVTLDEKQVIERVLLPLGFKDLIMVGNRIDISKNRERSRLFLQASVQEYTTQKYVFGVSAKEYLDGISEGGQEKVKRSGIPEFKEYLINFLTKKKGDLKIKKTAVQIVNSLKADFLESLIPMRIKALEVDRLALQKRVNEARPKLTAVEARRLTMSQNFEKNIPLALVPIKQAVVAFFEKLEKKIPEWTMAYKPKHDCGMYATKADLEAVVAETVEHVKAQVDKEYKAWNENTFQPILEEQCKMVFGSVKEDVMKMAGEIAVIEGILSGAKGADTNTTNIVERMAGIAAMAFMPIGRAGGDLFSGGFNLEKFLKNFIVDLGIGLGVGLLAFWVWPPLGFIAAIAGAVVGLLQGTERRIRDLKEKLSGNMVVGIKKDTPQRVSKLIDEIRTTFNSISKSVLDGVDSEIAAARDQLNELIKITDADAEKLKVQKASLEVLNAQLVEAVTDMNTLTAEIEKDK